jgi:hypothetical protein
MSKEQEENLAIIRKGEYIDEVEQKVMLEYNKIMASGQGVFKKREKKYRYTEHPDFGNDKRAKFDWEMNEIYKCKFGDGDIPGTYYYYLNHTFIKSKVKGKIRPEFRTTDLEWFKFVEEVQKNTGQGIVCIKRRQVGATTKEAARIVHSCEFNKDHDIGLNSKSENDSRNFFARVKYCYRNQSDFLRAITDTDRRDALVFVNYGKDLYGNKIIKGGTGSSVIAVSPSPTAHAGNSYKQLIIDEAGEIEDLEAIVSNAEDCIIQDGVRHGLMVLFGTMGNSDRQGKGLMTFWKDYKTHDLRQWAFWGYNELIMDEIGNDDILESVRSVMYRRRKLESSSATIYNKFIQKYPFNQEEAFLSVNGYGVGNPLIIAQQEINLMTNPPDVRIGRMKMVGDKEQFEPNPNGQVHIFKLPEKRKDGYTATLDPAEDDHVTKTKDSSDLGFTIVARPFGLMPAELVARYCHRPPKLEEAYLQIAMMLMMYDTKLHIEMNKGGWRAYDWFSRNFPHLLALTVKAANNIRSGVELRHGVKMNQDKKLQMEGLLNQYIDNYCLPLPDIGYQGIPDLKLLKQFKVFGADGQDDDEAVSFGWNLIIQQADKKVAVQQNQIPSTTPRTRFERSNGLLKLVTPKATITRNIPRSPFSR